MGSQLFPPRKIYHLKISLLRILIFKKKRKTNKESLTSVVQGPYTSRNLRAIKNINKKLKNYKLEPEAYSLSELRMRGIYSNEGVSFPPWAMQALLRCEGSLEISVVEARLPINWDNMSPKC